ncbi:hypothetical protein NpNSSI1_00000933 [Neofusicoccum parvum]|uniref:AA1-like domain-containing protein n=2 Tax=Neofusicoccum parvum TaxID=310453 RepID=R1GDL4_BOTPV|nr:hypothetical protein UCRNP2_6927 [Neofusicoccum parvum UCRNP2]GME49473.1 hypothetical protein NpPPO83_00005456 [Neofusicoccum parvum]GME59413.1 hypothetical protein NpNSSI1_00000933 [Neofusicoccum parvum]
MQLIALMITLAASSAAASPVTRQATNPTVPCSAGTFEMKPWIVSEYGEYRDDKVKPTNVGFSVQEPGLDETIRCSQINVAEGVEYTCSPILTSSPTATYSYSNGFKDISFSIHWDAGTVCEGSAAITANGTATIPEMSCQKTNRGDGDFCGNIEFEVPVTVITGVA